MTSDLTERAGLVSHRNLSVPLSQDLKPRPTGTGMVTIVTVKLCENVSTSNVCSDWL